eukprot:TRINITY_DN10973_c0_g1_i1.p1 TRINITY_DN10973_c0_g1~~TRINITY_DN10973_c0_g1_i1.p1  ORF type:complete len:378 (-),score=101.64 TRINITY_DN10973_c0_g1_i1:259-1392(-)
MAAEGEEEAPAPEPVPPLADEEYGPRQEMFAELFAEVSADAAKLASIKERTGTAPTEEEGEEAMQAYEEQQKKSKSLMYGEVPFETIHKLLNVCKVEDLPLFPGKGLFVDLGSGTGKTAVAAALLHPFEKVVGIECMQCLNDMANTVTPKYGELAFPEGMAKPEVSFVKGDFVAEFEGVCDPVVGQTVVALAHATAFGPEQMQAVANYATKMPDGSYFITFGQGLPDTVTFGLNRHPLQRKALLVKEALGKRGCDPSTTEIPELPVSDAVGWVEVHTEEVELASGPWGRWASKAFVYKKIPGPFTEGWANGKGPWEQLVDLDKDEAMNKLKEARADLEVELVDKATPIPEGEEPNETRVRIIFDPETNKVCEAPQVG